jgi:uncharacterized membrane protein (DUF2068 family)
MSTPQDGKKKSRGLMVIAVFKFIEGLGLVALGLGVRHALHVDWAQELAHWVDLLRMDPHSRYLLWAMQKLSNVDEHKLRELSVGTFFYAGLRFCEGTGLALKKRWAEYLTIVTTGALVPVEIYEICKHATWEKMAVLAVNLGVVAYLVWELRRNGK